MAVRVVPPPSSAPRALLRDLYCRCRRHGIKATARAAARTAWRALHSQREELVLVKRLDERLDPPPADDALSIEPLAARHAGALAELNRNRCFTRKDRRYAEWLARGYRGFAVYCEDELAGLIWWVDKRIDAAHPEVLHLGIELEDADVYSFDFYLAERHRGGGNAGAAFHRVERALRDLGYGRLWGYVVADNRPARWLYAVRGYEVVRCVVVRHGLFRRSHRRARRA